MKLSVHCWSVWTYEQLGRGEAVAVHSWLHIGKNSCKPVSLVRTAAIWLYWAE